MVIFLFLQWNFDENFVYHNETVHFDLLNV